MLALFLSLLLVGPLQKSHRGPRPDGGEKRVERVVLPRERRPLFMERTLANPDPTSPMLVLFHQARSSKGEYRPLLPHLRELGYNCLAVDLSSGEVCREILNYTSLRAFQQGHEPDYLDAIPDIVDALRWVREEHAKGKVFAWGSSFSASLCLVLAAEQPDLADGVIAFSPGEFFTAVGKSATWVRDSIGTLACPVFLVSSESEASEFKPLLAAIPAGLATTFVRPGAGVRGSPMLWEENPGHAEAWNALEAFLRVHAPLQPTPPTPPVPQPEPDQKAAQEDE